MAGLGWSPDRPSQPIPSSHVAFAQRNAAAKSREALTKIYKASKPKDVPAAPPKPRIAKGR